MRISIKIRLGRAISRARGLNDFNSVIGRIFCLMIRKPITPIPSRMETDSKVTRNKFIWCSHVIHVFNGFSSYQFFSNI